MTKYIMKNYITAIFFSLQVKYTILSQMDIFVMTQELDFGLFSFQKSLFDLKRTLNIPWSLINEENATS